MILVNYSDSKIEVSGHAGFDIKGKDIVCAGVSAIVQGGGFSLEDKSAVKEISNGKMLIELNDNASEADKLMLSFMIKQLKQIEKAYSKYLKVRSN